MGALIGAGIVLRTNPAAHKRLMLVASLVMTDAGFGRWLFVPFQLLPAYTPTAAVGVYDLISRRCLHPAYCWAVAFRVPIHLLAGWLYFQPSWHAVALRIIGAPPPPMFP